MLRLLALGHTNQEIAKRLFISVRTAETHRAHIMQKLDLGTRAELVRYALVNGLLEEEAPGEAEPPPLRSGERPQPLSRVLSVGHRPGRVADLEQPHLAHVHAREGVADEGYSPSSSILTSKTPPPPAGTSTVCTPWSARSALMSPST